MASSIPIDNPVPAPVKEPVPAFEEKSKDVVYARSDTEADHHEYPTEEELHTLRRVADKIPWKVYTLAFVELCERFSYYGTTVVCESCPLPQSIIMRTPLICKSHQLHPTASPSWIQDGCWIHRWPVWCLEQGPASLHRNWNFQPVLGLSHASLWCLCG